MSWTNKPLAFTMLQGAVASAAPDGPEPQPADQYAMYFIAPYNQALFDADRQFLGTITTDVRALSAIRNGDIARARETEFRRWADSWSDEQRREIPTFIALDHYVRTEQGAQNGPLVWVHREVLRNAQHAQETCDATDPMRVTYRDLHGNDAELPGTLGGVTIRPDIRALVVPAEYRDVAAATRGWVR